MAKRVDDAGPVQGPDPDGRFAELLDVSRYLLLPARWTPALPGSLEKKRVMAERVAARRSCFHPFDASFDERRPGALAGVGAAVEVLANGSPVITRYVPLTFAGADEDEDADAAVLPPDPRRKSAKPRRPVRGNGQ
jgi:hypothetical protein